MKKLGTLHWKFLGCFCRINSQSIKVFSPFLHSHRWFHKIASTSGFFWVFSFSKFLLDGGRIKVKEPAELSYTCSIYRVHFAWCYFLKLFCPFKISPKMVVLLFKNIKREKLFEICPWQWSENKTVYSNLGITERDSPEIYKTWQDPEILWNFDSWRGGNQQFTSPDIYSFGESQFGFVDNVDTVKMFPKCWCILLNFSLENFCSYEDVTIASEGN